MLRTACIGAICAALCSAMPALADTALLVGNGTYENGSRIRGANAITLAETPLREAGFQVIRGSNVRIDDLRDGLSRLVAQEETDRILIGLSGHFARSADGETWFLASDADTPDRGNIGGHGISLTTLMALAAETPGRAVILLGSEDRNVDLGPGLTRGIAMPEPPQGVTVMVGTPREIGEIARNWLPEPGTTVSDVLEDFEDVAAAGFISGAVAFIEAEGADLPQVGPPASDAEQALWDAVSELDTEGAYISYLRDHPMGRYADDARARIVELREPPELGPEEIEAALALTRNERRQIQRDLTVLGHDTNGIDGLFGPGSRAAIRSWQGSEGLPRTGYLTASAIEDMAEAAAERRLAIEAEEAIRQAERDRLDRAYWTATGRGTDEAGLRAYLGRYPDGLFADIAIDRLEDIDAARANEEAEAEAAAWNFAQSQDSVPAYRGYLSAYPEGEHVREARNRMAELRGEPLPFPTVDEGALQAQEASLNLPSITRLLIEQRLASGGYNPGRVDGQFDARTRDAIAAFQAAEGLSETGYMDQETLSRFLSNGIRVIVR